jgi:hypothetical protein
MWQTLRWLWLELSDLVSRKPSPRRRAAFRRPLGRRPTSRCPGLELLEDRIVPTVVAVPGGIVSWWTANNTAADVYGLNNATLTGVTYATGEVGQAFSFNGSNSRAEVADSSSLAFTASFTIEGWIKVNALPSSGNHAEILFRGADGSPSPYSLSVESDGTLQFLVTPAADNSSALKTPLSTGQWTHIAATLDDATGLLEPMNFFTCRTRRQGSGTDATPRLLALELLHLPHKAAGVGEGQQ